ncbi:MAG: gfo/Idh/MocA family oxidoreductase, partial [Planctomycetota bacterium]
MEKRRIGIIMNGVTGRMGTNQHLIRSVTAIIEQGGVKVSPDLTLMPDPILTGRNANKLRALAEAHGPGAIGKPYKFSTDVDGVIAGKEGDYEVFFDASGTLQRAGFLEKACASDMVKAVYCEKPTATETAKAVAIADMVEQAGKKNGVVQDKLWLSSFRKLAMLKELGFFGDILSVKGDFGYWVFSGMDVDQPMQ